MSDHVGNNTRAANENNTGEGLQDVEEEHLWFGSLCRDFSIFLYQSPLFKLIQVF